MTDTKNVSDKLRKTVFISHARPEDDELTRWLCGRLSALGYQVWADLEQLHGGDPFWTDIENTLRFDTIRFLSIVTHVSVIRKGVKDELAEACDVSRKLADPRFIIPVKGDDLPWDEFPIQLKQVNGLDFSNDWSEGFSKLLKTLERDQLPRNAGDPEVSRIASLLVSGREQIKPEPEAALRNWLSIHELPSDIHYFHTSLSSNDLNRIRSLIKVPHAVHQRLILSFASLDTVRVAVPEHVIIEPRYLIKLTDFLGGKPLHAPETGKREAKNHLSDIVRQAIEYFLRAKGLVQFDYRWFVPNQWRVNNEGRYVKPGGKAGYRVLVGKAKDLTWHFGISLQVKAAEPRGVQIVPHVLYSANGITPLSDQKHLRRRYCKLWWNDKWRDLLQAFLAELFGKEAKSTHISLGGSAEMLLDVSMMTVQLPVCYVADNAYLPEIEEDPTDWDDDEIEDDTVIA